MSSLEDIIYPDSISPTSSIPDTHFFTTASIAKDDESFGYELIVNYISPDNYSPYEDWWIYPQLINGR
jgi:hypothetical protein